MERKSHNVAGDSGFYHFYGVVENRNDPLKLGRLQVRIYGKHSENLSEIPTEHLPWAQVAIPLTSAPNAMPNVWDGATVFGFFADGIDQQIPIITHQLSVNGNSVIDSPGKKSTGFQDQREVYAAKPPNSEKSPMGINTSKNAEGFPYTHLEHTESGHIIGYSDEPGKESILLMHRSGSYIKINPNGSINVYSKGDINFETESNINFKVKKAFNILAKQFKYKRLA